MVALVWGTDSCCLQAGMRTQSESFRAHCRDMLVPEPCLLHLSAPLLLGIVVLILFLRLSLTIQLKLTLNL